MEIILASQSPRRLELLRLITPNFSVMPADIDEALPDNISADFGPEYLAVKKASHIAAAHPNALVIGADTSVILGDSVLGKPQNDAEARQMLCALSDNTHRVITGCALFYKGKHLSFSEETGVEFYPLSDDEIGRYLASGEHRDKAGAYGIQGAAALFVKAIHGDYFNVVGLPVAKLNRQIKNFMKICGESYE